MSNDTYNGTDAAGQPAAANTADQTTVPPEVPTTADLPMLPEFRNPEPGSKTPPINWRAALSAASLAAFLAAVAGIGCGAKSPIPKPSPATPLAGSNATLTPSAGRNLGPGQIKPAARIVPEPGTPIRSRQTRKEQAS